MPRFKFIFLFLVLVGSYFSLNANPSGENKVEGEAIFSRGKDTLTIKQITNSLIINWEDFSIQKEETTRFIQPSNLAVVLNRVMGGDVSKIYGNLEGNGKIYLINKNGILIGPEGRINTKSIILSTLDVANKEFLEGKEMKFSSDLFSNVKNLGNIEVVKDVVILAKEVDNQGKISAKGNVDLVGSSSVLFWDRADGVVVRMKGKGSLINNGIIEAAKVRLQASGGNICSLAINHTGIICANSAVNRDGRIILTTNSGEVRVWGDLKIKNGRKNGGTICIEGEKIHIARDAHLAACGKYGGGEILIGGNLQGEDGIIKKAAFTFIENQVEIRADAIERGDGGKIVIWGDEACWFFGQAFARGGNIGGNGGGVEISSGGDLIYHGSYGSKVETSAGNGNCGTFLLDPTDIIIAAWGGPGATNFPWANPYIPTGPPSPAQLAVDDLVNALASNNVVISTSGAGRDPGDITITEGIAAGRWTSDSNLILSSDRDIIVNDNIIWSGGGKLSLNATRSIKISSGVTISNSYDGVLFPALDLQANMEPAPTPGNFIGVDIDGTLSIVKGGIRIGGKGGTSNDNYGIRIGGQLQSTGTTDPVGISFSGIGGSGALREYGILLDGGKVISKEGDININGTSLGISSDNCGIVLKGGAVVESSGTAKIVLKGIGSNTGYNSKGVNIEDSSIINASRDVVVTGIGFGGGEDIRHSQSSYMGADAASGPITINADHLTLDGQLQTTGGVFIMPRISTTSVGIGTSAEGTLYISSRELSNISAGFLSIGIRKTGMHSIDINTAHLFPYPLIFYGRNISINSPLDVDGNLVTCNIGQTAEGTFNLHSPINGTLFVQGGAFNDNINIGVEIRGNFMGGGGSDTFIFADQAKVDGIINGGNLPAINTLDYTAYTTSIIISRDRGLASNVKGFCRIQNIIGSVVWVDYLFHHIPDLFLCIEDMHRYSIYRKALGREGEIDLLTVHPEEVKSWEIINKNILFKTRDLHKSSF